jgi:hypothetical protein
MTEENRKESSKIFLENEEGTSRTMNVAVLDCRRNLLEKTVQQPSTKHLP